ncbi:unnamed protein product, partial [Ectocarpus sp. 12 AP-2014]
HRTACCTPSSLLYTEQPAAHRIACSTPHSLLYTEQPGVLFLCRRGRKHHLVPSSRTSNRHYTCVIRLGLRVGRSSRSTNWLFCETRHYKPSVEHSCYGQGPCAMFVFATRELDLCFSLLWVARQPE